MAQETAAAANGVRLPYKEPPPASDSLGLPPLQPDVANSHAAASSEMQGHPDDFEDDSEEEAIGGLDEEMDIEQ